jgi:hypothetical protein
MAILGRSQKSDDRSSNVRQRPNMELTSSLIVPGLPSDEQTDLEVILYDIDHDQLANLRSRGICVTLNTECPGT